jgi:CHAD domain-containing protein
MTQQIIGTKPLHQPAERSARRVVLNIRKNMLKARRIWLEHVSNTASDCQNTEALHNLRVEMRRLRVWLHQTHGLIRTRSQARQQLKQWAQGSNTGRDLEVMLGLLQHASIEIDSESPAISLTLENKNLKELIAKQPSALKPKTRTYTQSGKKISFAIWLAERLSSELEKTLSFLKEDDETLHKARIHIKHMRYLIEPVSLSGLISAQPALIQLKMMQTRLGDMHDLFVLRQKLPSLLCGQLNDRLSNRLLQQGSLTRGIQQDFTTTRNQFTLYLRWQATRYDAAMKDWHSTSAQSCSRLENAVLDLIRELQNA